jgi:hypothetical protein
VSFDDALGDGKPESGPLAPGSGCLPKSVEYTRHGFRRDATARIRNSEDDLAISVAAPTVTRPLACVNLIALSIRFWNT